MNVLVYCLQLHLVGGKTQKIWMAQDRNVGASPYTVKNMFTVKL